jgi:hypothetical protein
MNFKKAIKIWAHLCDYTCDCNMCVLREFCRAEPCTLGEVEASIMESVLEKHNEEMLKSKYKEYIEENEI